jgi:hypothetical protein
MTIKIAPLALLLVSSLFAQRPGVVNTGPNVQVGPNAKAFGNILFPGGTPITFPQRLGNTVSGIIPHQGGFVSPPFHQGGRGGGGRDRTVVVPYAYPVYFGDPGYGYGYNQPQQPPVTVVMPQQQPTPTVIINQSFVPDSANPVLRDYSGQETPENEQSSSGVKVYKTPVQPRPAPTSSVPAATTPADDRATIFLIALKDNSIHTAVGYWVKDGTLHYVTPQGSVNRVTLDQVDKELSDRLNAERNVEFQLKGK